MDMENLPINEIKRLTRIYYQDKIWQLHKEGNSVRKITDLINRHYIPRSKFKGTTLSKSTIHEIIKKVKK